MEVAKWGIVATEALMPRIGQDFSFPWGLVSHVGYAPEERGKSCDTSYSVSEN